MPIAIPIAIAASSLIGAHAAKKGAKAQVAAADQANLTQSQQYAQTREDQAPWRQAGGQAVGAISSFLGLPNADGTPSAPVDYNQILSNLPGYQFQVGQGEQAVQRNLASRGLLSSGAGAKALTQYGQGMAQNYSGQYLGGLQSLAGLGQSATQATSAAGANAANQISDNLGYAGNAAASGYAGQANAINAGLSGLAGWRGYNGSWFGGAPGGGASTSGGPGGYGEQFQLAPSLDIPPYYGGP